MVVAKRAVDSKDELDDLPDAPDPDWEDIDGLDEDIDGPDEEWPERLPEPGATRLWITEAVFILVLLTPLIIWLIVRLSDQK